MVVELREVLPLSSSKSWDTADGGGECAFQLSPPDSSNGRAALAMHVDDQSARIGFWQGEGFRLLSQRGNLA